MDSPKCPFAEYLHLSQPVSRGIYCHFTLKTNFKIYLFFTFANQFQPIVANMYTSIGKAAAGALMSLTRQILFLMPLLIILPKFFGLDGAMYAAPVADFVAFLVAGAMLLKESHQLKVLQAGIEAEEHGAA